MYTSQKCSIHTPLQNHASIPFIHIEPKHNNKPEVNYIKEVVITQGKANRLKLAKKLQLTAEAKGNNSGSKMP